MDTMKGHKLKLKTVLSRTLAQDRFTHPRHTAGTGSATSVLGP